MSKNTFLLIFSVLLFQRASAQVDKDTVILLIKEPGRIVNNKDSADYILFSLPADNSGDMKLFPIVQIYPNGKRKMTGASTTRPPRLTMEGPSINFYPDGKRKNVEMFKNGVQTDEMIEYYPNGQVYSQKTYKTNGTILLDECRDSTGKVLAENGTGQWLLFSQNMKKLMDYGPVENGMREKGWHVNLSDTTYAVCTYHLGKMTSGIGYDKAGKAHPFTIAEEDPTYKGGIEEFYKFLSRVVRYPATDRENRTTGKVFVTFIVEKDGKLTNMKLARKPPSETLGDEALRSVKLSSPWLPGLQYGIPVRVQYTVPVNFTLGN